MGRIFPCAGPFPRLTLVDGFRASPSSSRSLATLPHGQRGSSSTELAPTTTADVAGFGHCDSCARVGWLGPSRQAPFRLRLQQTPSSSHVVRPNPRTVISLGVVHLLLAPAEYKTKLCAGSPFNPPVPRAPSPVASARRAPSLLPSPCRRAISSWSSSVKACRWVGAFAGDP